MHWYSFWGWLSMFKPDTHRVIGHEESTPSLSDWGYMLKSDRELTEFVHLSQVTVTNTLGFVNQPKALELPMCFSYQRLWQNVWCCSQTHSWAYDHWGCPLMWTVFRISLDSRNPRHICGCWKPLAWWLRRPRLIDKGGSIVHSIGFVTSYLGTILGVLLKSLGIFFSVPLFLLPGNADSNQNKTYVLL